jgi:hypothetical protein
MDDMKSGVLMDTYKCGGVEVLGKTIQNFNHQQTIGRNWFESDTLYAYK